MSVHRNSASVRAAALRAEARGGVLRRLLALFGVRTAGARRTESEADRWEHGARGEQATAGLLAALEDFGWGIRHDRQVPGRRFNLDHVLVSPCGTAVVVLDTKTWHRGRATTAVGGRVHCGAQDRHGQVEAVARYAHVVSRALRMPGVVVWPLLVVHGSPVAGGRLEVQAPGWNGVVHVLGPGLLVPTLVAAPKGTDRARAAALVRRVDTVLVPCVEPG